MLIHKEPTVKLAPEYKGVCGICGACFGGRPQCPSCQRCEECCKNNKRPFTNPPFPWNPPYAKPYPYVSPFTYPNTPYWTTYKTNL